MRVVFDAPPECPGEAVFLAAVRGRIGSEWEAAPGEPARTMHVTIETSPGESVARLDFVDAQGQPSSRALSGRSCEDVESAIALVTALAIDSRLAKDGGEKAPDGGEGGPGPAAQPGARPEASPRPAAPSRPAPVKTKRPEPAGSPPVELHRAPSFEGEVGVLAVASTGIGPAAAFGGRVISGIGWPAGAEIRIGVDYATVPATTVAVHDGVKVQMYEIGGRVSGCPLAVNIGERVRVRPCAGIASGIIHGETLDSPGVTARGSGNPAVVAPFAEATLDVRLGRMFVEAAGDVKFVVDHPTFALEVPNASPPLYDVPTVAVGASLGLGLIL